MAGKDKGKSKKAKVLNNECNTDSFPGLKEKRIEIKINA
jgi:hypothetical protein